MRASHQPVARQLTRLQEKVVAGIDAEANFFRVLKRVVGDRGHVLAQVSLRQLLWFPGNSRTNPGR